MLEATDLTTKQLQVAIMIALGATRQEVALKLRVGCRAIDRHRKELLAKIEGRHDVDIARYALRAGWVKLEETLNDVGVRPLPKRFK